MAGITKDAFSHVCSLCRNPVGTGKGKRTAMIISDLLIKLNPKKVPQLRGLVIEGEICICIICAEQIANVMIIEQSKIMEVKANDLI